MTMLNEQILIIIINFKIKNSLEMSLIIIKGLVVLSIVFVLLSILFYNEENNDNNFYN